MSVQQPINLKFFLFLFAFITILSTNAQKDEPSLLDIIDEVEASDKDQEKLEKQRVYNNFLEEPI